MSNLVQRMIDPASRLKPRRRTDRLQAPVLVVGLALVGLVWTSILYHLHLREVAVREQTHRDVANLSIGVEKHVERLLVGVDQVMRFIADDYASDPDTFDFAAWLKRSTSLRGVAHQISLFDKRGELLASRTPPPPDTPRFDIRDRDYFQALQASAERGLYIDRTLKGRITGRYVLQTARRLSNHDGSFAGVIVTSIDPDYLADQFKALDVGRHGSIAIFGTDGFVRARYPQADGMYERDVTDFGSGRGVFAHVRERPSGTYEVGSAFDRVTRIFGYRTVGSLPLIVTVGKSVDEVLAPLAGERRRAVLAGTGVTLVLLATLLLLIRGLENGRRQQAMLAAREAATSVAEAQAREANRLLTLAAQIAHIGHWRIGLPEHTLFWSEEVFAIFGRSPAAGAPTIADAIATYAPDDQAEVERCVDAAVREGRGFAFSARIVHADGSLRDVSCRGVCEVDASGTTTAVFGTIMDVTELRRTERAAVDSEARFRMLADNTSDMIVQVDLDTTRRYVSPASRDLLGYEPEELIGSKSLDMVHPGDRNAVAALLDDLRSGARKQALKRQRYRRKDGSYVWVEVSYRMIHNPDGEPIGCVACTRDVSRRVAAEKALTDSEYRFRVLAENTSELIMLGHDDGRRSYISPASMRLLGYTPEELELCRILGDGGGQAAR